MWGLPLGCVREAGRLISVDLPKISITIQVSRANCRFGHENSLPALRRSLCGVYLSGVSARRAG